MGIEISLYHTTSISAVATTVPPRGGLETGASWLTVSVNVALSPPFTFTCFFPEGQEFLAKAYADAINSVSAQALPTISELKEILK